MGIRPHKPWQRSDPATLEGLPGHMGVYEIADAAGLVLRIGYAGGRSLFGLRGEIGAAVAEVRAAAGFRYEVTTAYLSRYQELLMLHQADHGRLPAHNPAEPGLGRLSPG